MVVELGRVTSIASPIVRGVSSIRYDCRAMSPTERGAAFLGELREFVAFLGNLWGILAGISVFFPLSNVLVKVIPLGRYGDDGGVYDHLSPPLVTAIATLVTLFVILSTFARRSAFKTDRAGRIERRARLSFAAGVLALTAYLVIHTVYAQYAWSEWGWGSGDPRKLLAEVPLLATYCAWFSLITRAFLLLAMKEFFGGTSPDDGSP